MKRLQSKLTYANVISTLCLILLVGGGTAYAATQVLPKNSVGSKQIKNNAITGAKIKNGAVTGSKIQLSSLGTVPSATDATNSAHAGTADTATNATHATNADTAVTAATATNANALGGQPAAAFASSSSVRSVAFGAAGGVIGPQSDGIAQANVTHPEEGVYCINGLNPAPRTAVASVGFGAPFEAEVFIQVSPPSGSVCEGSEIGIATYVGTAADLPVQLIVH